MNKENQYSVGSTYKAQTLEHTMYVTINHDENNKVFEIFVRLDDPELFEMISLVTRFSSMLLQSGVEPKIIAKELMEVHSPITRHMIPKTNVMCPSIVSRIGIILNNHLTKMEKENVHKT